MKVFDSNLISEKVVSFENFKPFLSIGENVSFPSPDTEEGKLAIKSAEKYLDWNIPVLELSKFILFNRTGDRAIYQKPYFERRDALIALLIGELCEKKGRFVEKLMDVLFAICEESTWVLPAHNYSHEDHCERIIADMPQASGEDVWFVDLFSATTSAYVACAYYFLRDEFEKRIPVLFNQRIIYELNKNVLKPYLKYSDFWWFGKHRDKVNNWNSWINMNVLTTALFSEHSLEKRKRFAKKTAESINYYTQSVDADGGCDEGPDYWSSAGACVAVFAELCYCATDGRYSVFDNSHLLNIILYISKVHLCGNYYFNCADAHPKTVPPASLIRRMGILTKNDELYRFGNDVMKNNPHSFLSCYSKPYAHLCCVIDSKIDESCTYTASRTSYLPDLQICKMRENEDTGDGFCFVMKGGHNAENHNHLDVGNFILYNDGKPCIIDVGVGRYTKDTFITEKRYKMFAFKTEHHNLPLINGKGQWIEEEHHADDFTFDSENFTASMELKEAYLNKNEIVSYKRSAQMKNGVVSVCDRIIPAQPGCALFNLYLADKPEKTGQNEYVLSGNVKAKFSDGYDITVSEVVFNEDTLEKDWGKKGIYRLELKSKYALSEICLVSEFSHM